MNFEDFFGQDTSSGKRLAILSGGFPENGVAVPLFSRSVFKSAMRELVTYKGRTPLRKLTIRTVGILGGVLGGAPFKKKFHLADKEDSFFAFLKSKLGEDVTCSIYVGSRKFILPTFREKDGKLLGVAKAYFPGRESAYGENEAHILDESSEMRLAGFSFPQVLAKDYFRGALVVILSSFPNLKNARSITERHTDFLKQLSGKTGARTAFAESAFRKQIEGETTFLKSEFPGDFRHVEHFRKDAVRNLEGKEFFFSLTKREFPFFELFTSRADSTRTDVVIDWEHARHGFPPIFDVFSLLMSSARFKKGDYTALYEKNVMDLFFGKNKKARGFLRKMMNFWNIAPEDGYHFFVLYLIDQLYLHRHVGHRASAERITSLFERFGADGAPQKLWKI